MTTSAESQSPQSDPAQSKRALPKTRRLRLRAWTWPILWLSLLVGSSATTLWATVWLMRIPPVPNCEQISQFSADSDRLYCAKAAVASGEPEALVAALRLVAPWQEDHPLYSETRPVVEQWAEALVEVARRQVNQGNLERALELATDIPKDSGSYPRVASFATTWEQEWERGESIQAAVEAAIATQAWDDALETLQGLKALYTDYWVRSQFQHLQQRIQLERTAWTQWSQARDLAAQGDPATLGEAIAIAQRIHLRSSVWTEASQEINQWSQDLLLYGFRQWELGNLDGAIAAVQKVPADPTLAPEAQDLLQFSHAQRLAEDLPQGQTPSYGKLFQLLEAISAVQQIPPGSPFYDQAQAELITWQAAVKDLVQLQFAQHLASLGSRPAYTLAIQQASLVHADRPRRVQAQSLIYEWQQAIQQLEDRPLIDRAMRLASANTIPQLNAAIAQAQQVEMGRALRIEAQTRIAAWRNQIQVIEDQPILDEANTLAADGKLREAIATVRQIEQDRALYDQAQTSARDWQSQIELAEDGPLWRQAQDLAARGSLTAAIDVASQIGAGRALYPQARSAIALWRAEREYIWSIREQEAALPNARDDEPALDPEP